MKWLSVIASGGLLAILGLLLWFNGKDYCEKAHLKKQAEAVTNAVVARDEVVNEVVRASDTDLEQRYARWLRSDL